MSSLNTDVLIQRYFDQKNILINHQIGSYNYYVDEIIPKIINQYFPVLIHFNENTHESSVYSIELMIKNLRIREPLLIENNGCSKLMTPNMARERNSTYLSSIIVDFISKIKIKEDGNIIELKCKEIQNIVLGKIPIMVRSKYCILNEKNKDEECKFDLGGYFLINGNEKVIISQEKVANNMIQVFKNPKNSSKFSHICETRSLNENAYGIPKVSSIKITNKSDMYDNTLKISLPHVKQEVPLFVLFRAIGCGSDKDIIYHIIDNDNSSIDHTLLKLLGSTINEGSIVKTEEEAIIYLSKYINNTYNYVQSEEKKVNYVKDVILKEYLNHLGNDKQKRYFSLDIW